MQQGLYLVASEAARSDGLCMMSTAVQSPGGPEVHEVDQRIATLVADETLDVPCVFCRRSLTTDCHVTRRHQISTLQHSGI